MKTDEELAQEVIAHVKEPGEWAWLARKLENACGGLLSMSSLPDRRVFETALAIVLEQEHRKGAMAPRNLGPVFDFDYQLHYVGSPTRPLMWQISLKRAANVTVVRIQLDFHG